jgi:hypothetical protein
MKEMWKNIKGYEKSYQISNLGRVKSLPRKVKIIRYGKVHYKTISGRTMKPLLNKRGKGYLKINLKRPNRLLSIHQLVAKAFIPNPENKPFINHIDGDPKNNVISNLEWCTAKENAIHASKNGLLPRGENHPNSKLTKDQVLEIRKSYKPREITQQMLADKYGITKTLVRYILQRKYWTHI